MKLQVTIMTLLILTFYFIIGHTDSSQTTVSVTLSHGYDEIPIKILKSSIQYIVSPLVYIINRSHITGIFPD
jgi:hypothetical protein